MHYACAMTLVFKSICFMLVHVHNRIIMFLKTLFKFNEITWIKYSKRCFRVMIGMPQNSNPLTGNFMLYLHLKSWDKSSLFDQRCPGNTSLTISQYQSVDVQWDPLNVAFQKCTLNLSLKISIRSVSIEGSGGNALHV